MSSDLEKKSFHFVRSHDETLKFIIVDVDIDYESLKNVKKYRNITQNSIKIENLLQKKEKILKFSMKIESFLLLKSNFDTLRAHLQIFLV